MPDFIHRFGQKHKPDVQNGAYYFSNSRSGLIVALLSIGTLFGALIAAPIADNIGRKPSLMFWCVIVCIGVVVQISATDKWYQVMIGRFVAGLGVGGLSLLVPMYQVRSVQIQRWQDEGKGQLETGLLKYTTGRDRTPPHPRRPDFNLSTHDNAGHLPRRSLQLRHRTAPLGYRSIVAYNHGLDIHMARHTRARHTVFLGNTALQFPEWKGG